MTEFWESSFRDKQEMWGWEPADAAISTLELFREQGIKKVLIPGFGYGRNAGIFIDSGFDVTGIEISKTAIDIAKKHFGEGLKVYHGSVSDMPFEQDLYDGIFCYALIHLLNERSRKKLIADCYNQLKPDGYMVFITISKLDPRYRIGEEISKDLFETKHGITLFFYDSESVQKEFGEYGLIKTEEIREPSADIGNKPTQRFVQVICKKK